MKLLKLISKVIVLTIVMILACESTHAKVTWSYIKSPKYKTELKAEYNKIPLKARQVYSDNSLKIKIYGNNHYKNWAGLFNGNVNIESYQVSWLRSFYRRRGIYNSYSNKKLSMDYAKCTLIHELGHAYDYNMGWISNNKDFKNIYKKEKNKFKKTSYYKYPMGKIISNINNVEEYFASAFTVYVRAPKDLKKYCPKTYNYFKNEFKKAL